MQNLPLEIKFSRTRAEPVAPALRESAKERIRHYVELGKLAWPSVRTRLLMPTCSFDLSGRVAGMAVLYPEQPQKPGHIRINAHLLNTETASILHETVPHEVAHLIAQIAFGPQIEPHGDEWQRVMRSLGKTPQVYHEMETKPARVVPRPYLYRCACKDFWFTARRHGKTYKCNNCGELLVFIKGPEQPEKKAAGIELVRTTASGPGAQPSAAGAPPSEKQLELARSLAKQTGNPVPSGCLTDRRRLSQWIEQMLQLARGAR